jgi:hypothetical protein
MAQEKIRFRITRGPSKWDLMLALLYGEGDMYDALYRSTKGNPRHIVRFRAVREDWNLGAIVSLVIESLSREDPSGVTWRFSGAGFYTMPDAAVRSINAEGVFSTEDRTGTIEAVPTKGRR